MAELIDQALRSANLRLDATRAGSASLDDWIKSFLLAAPKQAEEQIRHVFSQVYRLSESNVVRSIPGIAAEDLLPSRKIQSLRRQQVALVKEGTVRQVRDLSKILRENRDLPVKELSKLIEQRTGVAKSKARLWARDQVLKFNASVTKERHLGLGIEEYYWISSNDERVRDRHAELANQKFRYDDPPLSDSGEPINPGEDYQCRCIASPVTASRDLLI